MALPPGFLDELRTRTSLAQVAGRKVMWDMRKSNQAKGDWWSPCPFHQEKSASFHVDDKKGFYYCFGCHAKGDIFSFVRETENVEFMEAVEILARDAGMPIPARDPRAQEKVDRGKQLVDVMEAAVRHYRMQLGTGAAAAAREYLERRGLDRAAIDRFEIGFAPDVRQGAFSALTGQGIDAKLIIEAGICAVPDGGGTPYDRFRGRIMFPIRDGRGRCIAFGGRAMDPNAKAKYYNSPETPLFDKSRSVYNLGPAREAAGKGAPLILAEGYMDVIALSEAGFGGAVAPLGTAVTPDQLQMLWRVAPEPIVCLDGDKAGLRAAYRVIDLAMPLLEAGRSLRFALMPEGKDPDDLIRAEGAQAMRNVLDAAMPMVDLLWRQETEGRTFDSPERRAALDKALADRTAQIRDPGLKRHYDDALKDLKWQLFRRKPKPQGQKREWQPGRKGASFIAPSMPTTRNSRLVTAGAGAEDHLREAVILAALISSPEVFTEFESQLERLECRDTMHATILHTLLAYGHDGTDTIRAEISRIAGAETLESLLADPHVALTPPVRRPGDAEAARLCLAEELAKLQASRGLAAEIAEAEDEMLGQADEAVTWRLSQAAKARNSAGQGGNEDTAEYDTGANGARINRAEREAFDSLLEAIRFSKSRK